MKTRRMFLVALCGVAMLIGASSCKKEKQENENGETMTIKASLSSVDNNSKTHLEGKKVMWDMGDAFKLFRTVSTESTKFSLTRIDETDGKVAYFEGKHPGDAPYYACYPFNNVSCKSADETGSVFEFEISESQSDVTNAGPMVGFMEKSSGSLVFQNAMSWLKVGLKGSVSIKRITLTDLSGVDGLTGTTELTEEMINNENNKKLNGTLTVTCSGNTESTFGFETVMSGGTNQLEIVSHDGFVLNGSSYTYFWFLVPNGSLVNLKLAAYISEDEDDFDVLQLPVQQIAGGINENTILTAEVSSTAINVTPATATTSTGCNNEFVYQVNANIKGNDPKLKAYKIGFCYSTTNNNPTIEDCDGSMEVDETPFTIEYGSSQEVTCDLTGLTEGTKYYIRSYATNGKYAYGNTVEVVLDSKKDVPVAWTSVWTPGNEGYIPHPFTIGPGGDNTYGTGDDVKVYFSRGNLQYIGSSATPYWKFAEHQFDVLLNSTGQNSEAHDVDRDLFGYGCTGNQPSDADMAAGYVRWQPWETSNLSIMDGETVVYPNNPKGYGPAKRTLSVSDGSDWGYNAILNGNNAVNSGWQLLGMSQWDGILSKRLNHDDFKGSAKIGGCICGWILLPDDWTWTGDVADFEERWTPNTDAFPNHFTYSEWSKMEAAGAVFLPNTGQRDGTVVSVIDIGGNTGRYWITGLNYPMQALDLFFGGNHLIRCGNTERYYGKAVRLVRPVE